MRVLIVGGGGREHALAWKIAQSPLVDEIWCAPGNAGTASLAQNIEIKAEDIQALAELAERKKMDLTVVGPEAPLVAGIVDLFRERGLTVFGPSMEAAQMEGSKSFAKEIMLEGGVATGRAEVFTDYDSAAACIEATGHPYVVKADGLAAGKGVIIAQDDKAAYQALKSCFIDREFGTSGEKVLIEEYLEGPEVSILAFVDGTHVLPMAPAQDYKRIDDGDSGPNTGGMGSYSPVPVLTPEDYARAVNEVLYPTALALMKRGIHYKGILYAGLMLTKDGPRVLEYNVRFGDPEIQAILPRLRSDIVEAMLAVIEGKLEDVNLTWTHEPCVTVVVASGGYPGGYEKGYPISGLEESNSIQGVTVFQAGTRLGNQGEVLTDGGRVLAVSALGEDFALARENAYLGAEKISFQDMYYRRDIAARAAGVT
ncbi:MAG: phosphoribosylamine--glycine ligase [Candidatus Solincola sediminis]|uniref:Phosphoribosylamine--glycine ligase n=1 Tax=Candidatus Solincola sediminis TaxID=1797199 RepID=A0A1F2WK80_9ACTN|nr:MAG: phosphoribosylamine--glycine ligase [Candidatus Solincola sediminis]OFW57257.1 MAG: phosphoribosylamine--glycine ligase [Candidatus Solincola sediminis]